jgi:hypothetical protein
VGGSDLLENVVLLSLEGGDLVGEARGAHFALVVAFDLCNESPVVHISKTRKY